MWLLSSSAALASGPVIAPLDVRNQHPIQLTGIVAPVRTTQSPAPGHTATGVTYDLTSLWALIGQGGDRLSQDGELQRLSFSLRRSLPSWRGIRWDLELRPAALHAAAGRLDNLIEGWHDLWGLPQNRRDEAPRDAYQVTVDRVANGRTQRIYALEPNRLRPTDLPVFLSVFPQGWQGERWHLGARVGVEIPLGAVERGFGNGGWDGYVGMLAERRGIRTRFGIWAGHALVHTPIAARDAGLRYVNPWSAGISGEWMLSPRWQTHLQLHWEQSLLGALRDSHARRDHLLIWLGLSRTLGSRLSLRFAFSEDLVPDVSPDITFHVGLHWAADR